ncbi:hypothetical protein LTR62_005900 [Meristemomyces frigidus]|uniref:tRNA (uracil(54)-C(5))-methyltransferase n=1 Tax=Meristemomyces frigidus TaxID=1508187 RepID=A0AAN7TP32_9PEZI|nr:hypothetical protein LTR62_005900 [Meristemomyces frigidus]
MAQKRQFNEGKRHFKKNKKQKQSAGTGTGTTDGSNEEVLLADVRQLLQDTKLAATSNEQDPKRELPEQWSEVDLTIRELSSTGDGLAEKDGQVYVVPFTAPGDIITAKVVKHIPDQSYTLTDFLSVKTPSQHRTETPQCKYFAQCSGCQFQHLPYSYQLAHKKRIVEKAYANFSNLPLSSIPAVRDTVGSPLQYGYRTKLTPHFDGPPMARSERRAGAMPKWEGVPPIGFMLKGTRKTMDIEDCPIGTEAVRKGMRRERARVTREIATYRRGATLLLRESTLRVEKDVTNGDEEHLGKAKSDEAESKTANGDVSNVDKPVASSDGLTDMVMEDRGEYMHQKTCITDSKATSTEYVENFRFDNPAGSFFQNNNSILPSVTQYIRDNILAPPTHAASTSDPPQIKNLIDAYCGSGFFTVTLSSLFQNSIGIDISPQSIVSARTNAGLNRLPEDSAQFIASDANDLFAAITREKFPPSETVVVIDPPRKGCDKDFVRQLLQYGPERVVYVSCNVHSQARDVGWLVQGVEEQANGEDLPGKMQRGLYEIESLRGFDFFPQTGHVEGVAVLRKKRDGDEETVSGVLSGASAEAGVQRIL